MLCQLHPKGHIQAKFRLQLRIFIYGNALKTFVCEMATIFLGLYIFTILVYTFVDICKILTCKHELRVKSSINFPMQIFSISIAPIHPDR